MKPGQHFRNLRVYVLAMQGRPYAAIAGRFGMTVGRVSQIVTDVGETQGMKMAAPSKAKRDAELVRRRDNGMSWEQLAADYGITPDRACEIYRAVRKASPPKAAPIIVRPREPREFRPFTLPTALRVNGARAAAVQPHLWSMASTPRPEWVD